MLSKTQELIDQLHTERICYCHWKSNFALTESLAGKTDIDLLIHRQDAARFRMLLSRLCFKPASPTESESFPSMEHYYALDAESGVLIHVHAYYRVITGESLTKNYHLPLEEMLLKNSHEMDSVRVPTKSAELVVFPLRIILKHSSIPELLMLSRYWQEVQPEIAWLLEGNSLNDAISLVKQWLPVLDPDLFTQCIMALNAPTSLFHRIKLSYQLRAQLRPYARHSTLHNQFSGMRKFAKMVFRRVYGSQRDMALCSGGAIIAFVGSDGTGKSTLLTAMQSWLGEHFDIEQIHVGKPKSTLLTFLPNLFVPVLRSLLPGARTTKIEAQTKPGQTAEGSQANFPLTFGLRSVLLAHDRKALLTRAYRQAVNRTIVLCDRYPSTGIGAPDSPQLAQSNGTSNGRSVRHKLARTEAHLYRRIPPPDLIIHLTAPLEVTLLRNAARADKDPEAYVRLRHTRSSTLAFGDVPVHKIDTSQPLEQTVLEVKQAVWGIL